MYIQGIHHRKGTNHKEEMGILCSYSVCTSILTIHSLLFWARFISYNIQRDFLSDKELYYALKSPGEVSITRDHF